MDGEKQNKLVEVQNEWKKVGFADKNLTMRFGQNSEDCVMVSLFVKRFFHIIKKEHTANLQLKNELCIQAEALIENTDWKKNTTEELKRLQAEEKTGLPVKNNQKIWERFRKACDSFLKEKKCALHFPLNQIIKKL